MKCLSFLCVILIMNGVASKIQIGITGLPDDSWNYKDPNNYVGRLTKIFNYTFTDNELNRQMELGCVLSGNISQNSIYLMSFDGIKNIVQFQEGKPNSEILTSIIRLTNENKTIICTVKKTYENNIIGNVFSAELHFYYIPPPPTTTTNTTSTSKPPFTVPVTTRESRVLLAYREYMNDTGGSFVEKECTTEMDQHDKLFWYHIKDDKYVLLNMTQYQDKGIANITLTLHHTLEDSDNMTEVVCVKESHTASELKVRTVVGWVQLYFGQARTPLVSGNISIKPNSKAVNFEPDTTMRFLCTSSTPPLDGRKLTWYMEKDAEYSGQQSNEMVITPGFEIPDTQKYDYKKNENVLDLKLSNAYHLKELFCAQDLHAKVIDEKGIENVIRFNQRERSNKIILVAKSVSPPCSNVTCNHDGPVTVTRAARIVAPMWSLVVVAAVAAFIFIAFIIAYLRLRKTVAVLKEKERLWNRAPLQTPNENTYEPVYGHGGGLLRRPKK